jgi:hypothetical protein
MFPSGADELERVQQFSFVAALTGNTLRNTVVTRTRSCTVVSREEEHCLTQIDLDRYSNWIGEPLLELDLIVDERLYSQT